MSRIFNFKVCSVLILISIELHFDGVQDEDKITGKKVILLAANLYRKNNTLKNGVIVDEKMKTFTEEIEQKLKNSEEQLANIQPATVTPQVHFTAHTTAHQQTTGTMPFPTVVSDQNSGLVPDTGVVHVKTAGQYHVVVTLMKFPSTSLDVRLMLNNKPMCRAMSNDTSKYQMVTCSATFKANVGDQIYIKLLGGRIHCCEYSTFTGFLTTF